MFDHVTIRVSDPDAARRFYDAVLAPLGVATPYVDGAFAEWGDLSIAADGRAVTRNLHVAVAAGNRAAVDAFHRAGIGAGYRSNGAPGERPEYHAGYYGAFLLDPDGNNVEAVCQGREAASIDHVSLRVRDRASSERFYELALATMVVERYGLDDDGGFLSAAGDLWLYDDGPPTEGAHVAIRAPDCVTVDRFHAVLVEAGFRSNGAPGERPEYHAGYYGAFVLDPDGNNVEAVHHGGR